MVKKIKNLSPHNLSSRIFTTNHTNHTNSSLDILSMFVMVELIRIRSKE